MHTLGIISTLQPFHFLPLRFTATGMNLLLCPRYRWLITPLLVIRVIHFYLTIDKNGAIKSGAHIVCYIQLKLAGAVAHKIGASALNTEIIFQRGILCWEQCRCKIVIFTETWENILLWQTKSLTSCYITQVRWDPTTIQAKSFNIIWMDSRLWITLIESHPSIKMVHFMVILCYIYFYY